jgi:murein DD-endopeptidase MepM/ murein hydrolase activator NlpD
MKKIFLLGISVTLIIPLFPLIDWIYYRDLKPFMPPVHYAGEVPIRRDDYGDGYFGAKRRGGRLHKGLDISVPLHSEVLALKGGRVKTGYNKNGMGKYVIIAHHGDCLTIYGHLSTIRVENKQRIRQGTIIGQVGKTGNARYKKIKPHLHFEVRKEGKHLDPLQILACEN